MNEIKIQISGFQLSEQYTKRITVLELTKKIKIVKDQVFKC